MENIGPDVWVKVAVHWNSQHQDTLTPLKLLIYTAHTSS